MRFHAVALCAVLSLLSAWPAVRAAPAPAPFHYQVVEGENLNYFLRDGASAAHLLLRSGQDLRVLVAFPAGDSGVGLWFEHQWTPCEWTLDTAPIATQAPDAQGRALHGITFEASVATNHLVIKQAVLSSVRVLRDYQTDGAAPPEVLVRPEQSIKKLSWSRDRLDGAPGYRLSFEITDGSLTFRRAGAGMGIGIAAGADGRIRLRVTALTGETPLTPLSAASLFNGSQGQDPKALETLTFLSYQEKLLAGSWRFDTYFGRDTLMSVRLLMPVLTADAIEAGLNSVLSRLAPDGEVAHEEAIGEFAVLSHRKEGGAPSDTPVLDYAMIDGNYLLAPVLASYLLDTTQGQSRGAAYLKNGVATGLGPVPAGEALMRNLRLVLTHAAGFATEPRYDHLLALKQGRAAGEWRDSNNGIGGGLYPYDVNAVFMPAALDATVRLVSSGLLEPFLKDSDRTLLKSAADYATIWHNRAGPLFTVSVANTPARAAITAYAEKTGVAAKDALASLGTQTVTFHAISLDATGHPVPVLNSDEGFALLFKTPPPAALEGMLTSMLRPFPLGLMTEAGMVVANPVFADAATQARFSNHAYHGTVIWSWQQALTASGLARQLARTDLPAAVKAHIQAAQQAVWKVIDATQSMEASELWSWRFKDGHYQVVPFGATSTDADESNAAQLWSSVYLAVKPPAQLRE
jgi:hypothetical protein